MIRRLLDGGVLPVRAALFIAWLFIGGCTGGTDVGNPQTGAFANAGALHDYLVEQYAVSALPTTLLALSDDAAAGWTQPDAYATERGGLPADGPLMESLQEGDHIQRHGNYIYVNGGHEVRIVSTVTPETMQVVGRIPVPGEVNTLNLYDRRLVILYTPTGGAGFEWPHNDHLKLVDVGLPYWIPVGAETGVLIVDLPQPDTPVFLGRIEVDGYLRASRMIEGTLFLLTQFLPDLPAITLWHDGSAEGAAAAASTNRQALAGVTLNDMVPFRRIFNADGVLTHEEQLIAIKDFVRPEPSQGGSIVSLITIPLEAPTTTCSATGFVADVHHTHLSPESLYLISTIYSDSMDTSSDAPYRTRIHQFDMGGPQIAYTAEGTIEGHIVNPFSLNNYAGVLRIATTSSDSAGRPVSNQVVCLQNFGRTLQPIGLAEDIAPGKRLYSARFGNHRAILSVAEENAPFLTMDLSDPRFPTVVGDLHLPGGHPALLHPISEDRLLVLEKNDVSEDDLDPVLTISLVDTSDFSAPEPIFSYIVAPDMSDSTGFQDPKAFVVRPDLNLVAFPVTRWVENDAAPGQTRRSRLVFEGIQVYQWNESTGFDLKGQMPIPLANSEPWVRAIFRQQAIFAVSQDQISAARVEAIESSSASIELLALP